MEHQDQQPIETIASQISKCPEERQDKNCPTHPYRSPQVLLIGKAKHLMAGYTTGHVYDSQGGYTYS